MKAIDNKELILALEELEKEKGIKKEYVLESIETALVTAYKRNFDALENVKVDIDHKTGATHIYSVKEIVENANDEVTEISLEEAHKINKNLTYLHQHFLRISTMLFSVSSHLSPKKVHLYYN